MEKRIFENPKIKDRVTVLKSPAETNQQYLLLEIDLAPKGGNALHYHTSFTEEFIPVEGALGVGLANRQQEILPGSTAFVKKGELHRFYNPTDHPIKFRVRIAPAHEGFLQSLKIAYGLAADGLTTDKGIPKRLSHLALLTNLSDTNMPGILTMINPLLKRIAARARRKGVYDELVSRYC